LPDHSECPTMRDLPYVSCVTLSNKICRYTYPRWYTHCGIPTFKIISLSSLYWRNWYY